MGQVMMLGRSVLSPPSSRQFYDGYLAGRNVSVHGLTGCRIGIRLVVLLSSVGWRDRGAVSIVKGTMVYMVNSSSLQRAR